MANATMLGEMATALRWLAALPDQSMHARQILSLAYARNESNWLKNF